MVYSTANQTRLQLIVPDELRGRVMSLNTLLFMGTTPIGSLIVGGIAEHWSVEVAIEACAALAAAGLVFAWFYQRHRGKIDRQVSPPSLLTAGTQIVLAVSRDGGEE